MCRKHNRGAYLKVILGKGKTQVPVNTLLNTQVDKKVSGVQRYSEIYSKYYKKITQQKTICLLSD